MRLKYSGKPGNYLRLVCLALSFFIGISAPALAHRAHAGLTEIAWNTSTREIEITHRLYAHDLEPRLFHSVQGGWEETPEGVAKIGKYVRAHFSMANGTEAMPLTYVGTEPDGEFIYVYFTTNLPEAMTELNVHNAMLVNAFDDQVNLVNLTLGGQTQSQYFRFGDKAKPFVWGLIKED